MKIRQEENSPIGNYFHDSGVWTLFNALSSTVDDFEIDTDQLCAWCEGVISSIKGLEGMIKKCEKNWIKREHQQEMRDMMKRGVE